MVPVLTGKECLKAPQVTSSRRGWTWPFRTTAELVFRMGKQPMTTELVWYG